MRVGRKETIYTNEPEEIAAVEIVHFSFPAKNRCDLRNRWKSLPHCWGSSGLLESRQGLLRPHSACLRSQDDWIEPNWGSALNARRSSCKRAKQPTPWKSISLCCGMIRTTTWCASCQRTYACR